MSAVVIAAGRGLPATAAKPSAQTRYTNNVADYLDSIENTDNDAVYDAEAMPRNSIYNDQVMIVAP